MKIKIKILLSLICSKLAFAAPTEPQVKDFIKSNQQFALSLYTQLEDEHNLVFSPYSISSCLAMMYMGARGETANELQKLLCFGFPQNKTPALAYKLNQMLSAKDEKEYQFNLANGLWVQKDSFVLSDFRHALQDDFEAQVDELDFGKSEEAIQIINEWTSNTTQGKIPHLLKAGDVDKSTRLILTNALFFKGSWLIPFSKEATQDVNFFPTPKTSTIVPMMSHTGFFSYFENDQFQLIALPFSGVSHQNHSIACLLLLPREDVVFNKIDALLSPTNLENWIENLSSTHIKVCVPKFTLTQRYNLNRTLQNMGLKEAFTEKANFSGIDGMRDLLISQVIHETYFAFNEDGVTASAATAGMIGVTSFPEEKPRSFIANRPFLFMLIDLDAKLPIFIGKLTEPS